MKRGITIHCIKKCNNEADKKESYAEHNQLHRIIKVIELGGSGIQTEGNIWQGSEELHFAKNEGKWNAAEKFQKMSDINASDWCNYAPRALGFKNNYARFLKLKNGFNENIFQSRKPIRSLSFSNKKVKIRKLIFLI